jgi:transitional endoplasmic reticulum ATPase
VNTSAVPSGTDLENAIVGNAPGSNSADSERTAPDQKSPNDRDSAVYSAAVGPAAVGASERLTAAPAFSGPTAATSWTIRDFHESDIERAVQLCEDTRLLPDSTPLNLVDLVLSLRSQHPAIVAVSKSALLGFIIAEVRGDRAAVTGMRIDPQWRHQKIGSQLLRALEDRLLHLGVRRVEALLGHGQIGEEALINRGFTATHGLTLYSKDEPLAPSEVNVLEAWGGELIDANAWDEIAGMTELKRVIDDRIVRPILEDDLAKAYGLRVPATVILFGPPGTGKTSFARAVAGRLGWPFVELLSSKLASSENGLATELGRALSELGQLDHVVAFIDEFDEISANRTANPGTQAVVNELLKAIPPFRSQPGRLLICATNFIERIDPAIIRPGRFDLVVPVGPPDDQARCAMWESAVARTISDGVDIAALATATRGFTPADLFLSAERAAFGGFTRTRQGQAPAPITTSDFLEAIRATRPSLNDDALGAFDRESRIHQRL